MNTLIITILSLSLSGAILIAALFLCKPLYKERLSKRWQYYVWLIVLLRLMLPLTFEVNLVGGLFDRVIQPSVTVVVDAAPSNNDGLLSVTPNYPGIDLHTPNTHNNAPYSQAAVPETQSPHLQPNNPVTQVTAPYSQTDILGLILPNLWFLWLMVAIVLFVRKVTIYQSFVRHVKAGRVEVDNIEVMERLGKILEQENINKTIDIYTHSHISSPLLIGFFRPYIVLPTLDISETDFRYTILHELTHYKRRDMFYKWLVQLVICLHWFNPLVHLMGREINNLGELSCDEAVIKNLDNDGMRAYGDNLLNASKMDKGYSNALASVTLSSNKKILKERLDLIMKYKKKSKRVAAVAICATMLLTIGAVITGAYAVTSQRPATNDNATETSQLPAAITNHATITNEAPHNENLLGWHEWFNSLTPEQQDMVSFRPPNILAAGNSYAFTPSFTPVWQSTPRDVERFEIYREFGLIYNPTTNRLYFNGEVVRFFYDMIPIPNSGGEFGISHLLDVENGAVDVRAVRDFSQMNIGQGAVDLRLGLLGIEPFTQEEFEAREIVLFEDVMLGLANSFAEDLILFEQFGLTFSNIWATEDGRLAFRTGANVYYNGQLVRRFIDMGGHTSFTSSTRGGRIDVTTVRDGDGNLTGLNVTEARTIEEIFMGVEAFGITFSNENFLANRDYFYLRDNIYYQGRLVRSLIDENFYDTLGNVMTFSIVSEYVFTRNRTASSLDVYVLRDENGNITGLNAVEK